MQDKYFSQSNAIPETDDSNSTVTQRLDNVDYAEKMDLHYKQSVQHETVPKTEEPLVLTPPVRRSRLRELSSLMYQAQRVLGYTPMVVIVVIVGVVTLLVQGYRLSAGPDVFSDEGIYLAVGTNVARGIGLVADNSPFLYHPPVYFLIEAAYIKLAGLTNTNLLTVLFSVRYLNIFFSAITASVLLLFGRKLHSYKAGLFMVALFLMDPYVQRINRRDMLETLAMLCLLLGIYIFFTHKQHLTKWQCLGSGIAFGLATLTKEPMFFQLFALLGVVAWTRRSQLIDAVRVVAIACLLYLSYPIWEIAVGEGPLYFSYKRYQVGEVVGSIIGSIPYCPNKICISHSGAVYAPKRISLENFQLLLGQYGGSYLLIALAGVFTIILFLRFRYRMEARYLFAWSILSFGFGILFGRSSDQYFYDLIVPVVLISGYYLATLFESFQHLRWWRNVLLLTVSLLFLYNSSVWMIIYGYRSDNGYAKIIAYVEAHIPPGEAIDPSDDAGYFFLSPTYTINYDRDINSIIANHDHYFIMSSKDRWGGFNTTTPEFYDWVVHNSQPLLVEQETSFWTIGLYYLKEPKAIASSTPPPIPSVTMVRSYLGTLYDISTGVKTNISLTNIQQQQWNISGDFGGMPENTPFRGTINAAKQLQFKVTNSMGQTTTSFKGVIQPDGSIEGTYCSTLGSAGKCSHYGLWSVSPSNTRPSLVGSSYPTQSINPPTIQFYDSLTEKRRLQYE